MTTVHVIWWHEAEHTQHDLDLHVARAEEIRARIIALCGGETDIHFYVIGREPYEAH